MNKENGYQNILMNQLNNLMDFSVLSEEQRLAKRRKNDEYHESAFDDRELNLDDCDCVECVPDIEDVEELAEEELIKLSDFTIICKGGEKIPTFKLLLAMRSNHFKVCSLFVVHANS